MIPISLSYMSENTYILKKLSLYLNLHLATVLILRLSYVTFFKHNILQTYFKYNSCTLKIFNQSNISNQLTYSVVLDQDQ